MSITDFLYYLILPVLALSALLIFVRFLWGPSLSDRVIALELLVTTAIGIICVYSVFTDQANFLDIAMIMALIGFLGTVAFAYYIDQNRRQ